MSKKLIGSNLLISRKGAVLAVLFSLIVTAMTAAQQKPAVPAQVKAQVAQLPLAFEPNQGQADRRVKFLSRGTGYILALTRDEAILALGGSKTGARDIVRLKLAGAKRNAQTQGLDALEGKTNYFVGNDPNKWRTNISNFGKVRYAQVYPGVDLLYYGKENRLEHDFIISPNADPSRIALSIKGAKQLRVDEKGNLMLTTESGQLQLEKPFIYQTDKNGQRVEIAGGFVLKGDRVSFTVSAYDKSRELIIDPVLNYSTYLSSASTVTAKAVAVDSSGNAYITGSVAATGGTPFAPTTFAPKAADSCFFTSSTSNCATAVGGNEVFVAKVNASGTGLSYLSIIGGTGADVGNAIAVDSSGNAYVTGQTSSADFPTTTNALQRHLPVAYIQLTAAGSGYSSAPTISFTGGGGGSGATATTTITGGKVNLITITNGGTGYTSAPTISFSTSGGSGAAATATVITAGQPEVFALKLSSAGTALSYSTYLSGSGTSNNGTGIAVDSANDMYITGSTNSADFSYIPGTTSTSTSAPTLGRGIQNTNAGSDDLFLVKVHPAGGGTADLKYATYLGGTGSDLANALAAGGTDDIYLTGKTSSTVFPFTVGAAQVTKGSTQDAFVMHANTKSAPITVAKCANSGTTVTITAANTFAVNDVVTISGVGKNGLDFNGSWTVATASSTNFTYSDATGCAGANKGNNGTVGPNSAAVLSAAKYVTLMGGDGNDEGTAIAVDALGNAYVTGSTLSSNASVPQFPDKANAIQATGFAGTQDAFIAKVAANGGSFTYSAYLGATGTTTGNAIFVNPACNAVNACEAYIAGQTDNASLFNINALQSANGGGQDGFVARVNGAGNALIYSTFLGGGGDESITGMAGRFPASLEPEAYVVGTSTGTVSVTSSAFQTQSVSAGSFVAKLQANNATGPVFAITGAQLTPAPPQAVGTDGNTTTSATYRWTITNTNAASAVTVDLPTPRNGSNQDLLTITGAPTFTGTVSGTCTTPKVGSPTAGPGGVTCSLGNVSAPGNTVVAVSASPTSAAACTAASCNIAVQASVASAEQPSGTNPATNSFNILNGKVITLNVTGTATSNITGGAVYNQGTDTSLTYDISVQNNSLLSNVATNVTIAATYPANFTVANITSPAAGAGCTNSGGILTCPIASIANGATGHVTFNGSFSQAANNPALGMPVATTIDPSEVLTGSLSPTINVDYRAPGADLDVTNNGGFSAAPDPVRGGQPLTFTVNYTNNGPLDATNVTLTQAFNPSVVQTAKFTATTMPSFCTQASAGASVICAIPDSQMLANVGGTGASATAVLTGSQVTSVVVNTQGSGYTAVPAVSLVGGGGTGATATAVLTAGAVTAINITAQGSGYTTPPVVVIASGAGGAAATAVTDGNAITAVNVTSQGAGYTNPTITLVGGGGTGAVASAVVNGSGAITSINVDAPGFGYTSAPTVYISGPQSFTVSGTAPLDANVATLNLGSTVTITTTGTATDSLTANSTASVSPVIRREEALSVSAFSAPSTVADGQTITYTFNVANGGLDDATSTVVTLSMPQNANSVTFSGNGNGTTACSGTTTVTCTIGTVTAGASNVAITVTATPSALSAGAATASFNGSITGIASPNAVSVGGTKTAANILTTVQRQTTISVANLANTGSPVASSSTAGYTVDVFNNGANIATNVKLDFTVPSGTTTPTAGCSVQSATVIRCNVASVPIGGVANKVTLAVSFTPPASLIPSNQPSATFSTSVTFNASASTEVVDAGTGALTSPVAGTVDVTVERRADVQMFALTATTPVSSDGNITVQAQVQNLSGSTATNVQVVFTFDHNYRFVSANVVNANGIPNSPAFSCAVSTATTRTCTIPDLPLTTLYTFNVIVQPESGIIATNNPTGNKTTVHVSATISASVVQTTNTGADTISNVATEVQRQANLRASGANTVFTGPGSAINSSATATYNATVRNDGPDATDGGIVVFSFTNNVVLSLDTSPAAQTAWGGLGTCVRTNASTVTCTMAANFTGGAFPAGGRSGAITITPDTATLLAATNSATYDVSMFISSANAYDNGTLGAAGSDNTSGTVTTTVQRQADIQLVSKIAPNAVADGGPITYTITVRNNGPDSAGSVRLIDPLPSVSNGTVTAGATGGFTLNANGANFTSPNPPGGVTACTPVSASPTAPPVSVVCMVGPLNSGETATITITGVANIDAGVSSASFNNVATVDAASTAGAAAGTNQTATDTNGGNNSNSVVSTTVSRSADLVMTTVNSTPVLVGGTLDPSGPGTHFVVGTHQSIQYDVTVLNNAISSTSVSTASVQTTLPSTLTFNSTASALVGTCNAAGQVVTCPVSATLTPGGASATVSFVAVPGAALPTSGNNLPITITPSVGAAGNTDPDPSNNTANNTTTIDRVSDLGIAQTAPATPVPVVSPGPAATFTYTWTLNNAGPSNATGVSVTDILPADLQFVSGSWPAVTGTSAGTCTGATTFGATITCPISTMNSGATVTVTVTVRPTLNTALANKFVSNLPQITGQVQDTNSGDNADSDQIELRGVTDLAVTITPVQNPAPTPAGQVLTGDNQTWAVKVTNNGPYPAGSVITLTDTLASGVSLVSVLPAAGGSFSCVGLTCTLNSLPIGAGAAQTVNVTTTTPAAAVTGQTTPLSNSAVVTQYSNGTNTGADVTDSNIANNTATVNITGRAAADLVTTQTAPPTVVVGQSGTKFTVTVTNTNGRSDATNVVLTNTIAVNPTASVNVASGTPSQGTCNAATGLGTTSIGITCNLGTIATGANATVTISMTPTLAGSLANTPVATLTEVDPVSANNTAAVATVTVNTTPPGQQSFSPTDPGTGQPIPSAVISGFITIPGNTTMTVASTSSLALPAKYQFGNAGAASNFYTISNTAAFSGAIQVCFSTPEAFFQPQKARVFALNPADDRTIAAGFVQTGTSRKVCGSVPTLPAGGTTFVVMEPINTAPPLTGATVTITGGGGKGSAGTSVTLDGSSVIDPDTFKCIQGGVDTQCVEQSTLIFRWVGNFTDVATIDPATGLKVIVKDCSQNTTINPFFDGKPCNQALTSLGLGASSVTLQVFDDFYVLNPPAPSRTFAVGSTGGGVGGVTTQTVSAGQTGTFSFPFTFGASTTFTVTGTPSLAANGITCTAQPVTYSGVAGGTQTTNVTVLCSTSGAVFANNNSPQGNRNDGSMLAGVVGLTGLPLVGMVLMPGRSRRQRMLKMFAIFALIALMVVFSASCGGGSSSGSFGGAPKLVSAGTAKGDYLITVTATPAPTAGNPVATLTLTVQ